MSPLNASSMWTQKSPPSQNIFVFSISWLSQLIAVDKLLSMLILTEFGNSFVNLALCSVLNLLLLGLCKAYNALNMNLEIMF